METFTLLTQSLLKNT